MTLELNAETLETLTLNLIRQAVTSLPTDVKDALHKAYMKETSGIGKKQLETILKNIELAEELQAPICQDTGTLNFYVRSGAEVQNLELVQPALERATKRATLSVPLRPNAVNPFTNKNSSDNTGKHMPIVHWEINGGDTFEITVLAKGGGSENASALGMLNPGEGVKGLKRFVVNAVVKAGAQPCPPTILGVAVGGSSDVAMQMAKKVLLRPLNETNGDPQIASLETELLEALNQTGIGPMGLGGKTTVLGVHIDYAYRHPASFPVAVAFNCWASRRATAKITQNGTIEYTTQTRSGRT